jgi:hypothetical protein
MYCVDEVDDLVIKAQKDIIDHKGSYNSWNDRITNAIIQCPALGEEKDRDGLVLKVRNHLENVGKQASGPRVKTLEEIIGRPLPLVPIKDERRP